MREIDVGYVEYLTDNHPSDKVRIKYSNNDKYKKSSNNNKLFYIKAFPKHSSIDLTIIEVEKIPFIRILKENRKMYMIYIYATMILLLVALAFVVSPVFSIVTGIALFLLSPLHFMIFESIVFPRQGKYSEKHIYPTFSNNYKITYYDFPETIKLNFDIKEEGKLIKSKALEEAITNPFTSFPTVEIIKNLNNYKNSMVEKDYNHTIINKAEKALYNNIVKYELKEFDKTNKVNKAKAKELKDKNLLEEKHRNKLIEAENELLNSIHVAETIQDKNNKALYW